MHGRKLKRTSTHPIFTVDFYFLIAVYSATFFKIFISWKRVAYNGECFYAACCIYCLIFLAVCPGLARAAGAVGGRRAAVPAHAALYIRLSGRTDEAWRQGANPSGKSASNFPDGRPAPRPAPPGRARSQPGRWTDATRSDASRVAVRQSRPKPAKAPSRLAQVPFVTVSAGGPTRDALLALSECDVIGVVPARGRSSASRASSRAHRGVVAWSSPPCALQLHSVLQVAI